MAYERLKNVIKSPEQSLHRQLSIQANSPEFLSALSPNFPKRARR